MPRLPPDHLDALIDDQELHIEVVQAIDGLRHIDLVQRLPVENLMARKEIGRPLFFVVIAPNRTLP